MNQLLWSFALVILTFLFTRRRKMLKRHHSRYARRLEMEVAIEEEKAKRGFPNSGRNGGDS
ncbi:hypothetical protein KO561_09520 [Radiobacillus kanasensis]|uniref:hypothetical protein n=1 Tax=Radiobacillus kanasensis TaxID=2844358 RepID=UPI001E37A467|nr:hypothetical protein [Radiobacillus kanasensis]UFU01150.1 hypothetical protein KO561_09520 [Radiobacillus kanasensis]